MRISKIKIVCVGFYVIDTKLNGSFIVKLRSRSNLKLVCNHPLRSQEATFTFIKSNCECMVS